MATIPASAIVQVNPQVLEAGGRALEINGVLLTNSTRVPIGDVHEFDSVLNVQQYFGPSSTEASLAANYFSGFDNSNTKPERIFFAQYNTSAVAAYLRGGSLLGVTLAQLKAFAPGTITLTVNGTNYTSGTINLSGTGVTSFSAAANVIQAAFSTPPFAVTYDSIIGSFVFTSTATGTGATITYATQTALSGSLKLTQATGAVLSQGAAAAVPGPLMDSLTQVTQNWATFMITFDPDFGVGNSVKFAFCQWTAQQNNRYCFVCWDTDLSPATTVPATASLGYLLQTATQSSGVCLIGTDGLVSGTLTDSIGPQYAAFICGAAASIDFEQRNGRITFAFRHQSGLFPTATNQTAASNLGQNGYNYYGAYATANDQFIWFYPGQISGEFLWLDSYIDQIWMNAQFQLDFMEMLDQVRSIPYNAQGRATIEAAMLDTVYQAVNFGAIRAGVTLSQLQRDNVNNTAGVDIADIIQQRGWYIQVLDATPQVRQARKSPPINFWYTDGQSVHQIQLASIELA